MNKANLIQAIQREAKRRTQADEAKRSATAELRILVGQAKGAGMGVTQIAREAGLSRQAVYDLLADQRPS